MFARFGARFSNSAFVRICVRPNLAPICPPNPLPSAAPPRGRNRNDGIGRNRGERIQDGEGLAAPVSDSSGEVVAGVLIAGPAVRMAAPPPGRPNPPR
jgi:hypothetical protein